MTEVKSCTYNHDTGAIDVTYESGGKMAVLCNVIEETLELSTAMRSKFDWLIFNEPQTFVELILSDELERYLEWYDKSYRTQESNISKSLENYYIHETVRAMAREYMMYDN